MPRINCLNMQSCQPYKLLETWAVWLLKQLTFQHFYIRRNYDFRLMRCLVQSHDQICLIMNLQNHTNLSTSPWLAVDHCFDEEKKLKSFLGSQNPKIFLGSSWIQSDGTDESNRPDHPPAGPVLAWEVSESTMGSQLGHGVSWNFTRAIQIMLCSATHDSSVRNSLNGWSELAEQRIGERNRCARRLRRFDLTYWRFVQPELRFTPSTYGNSVYQQSEQSVLCILSFDLLFRLLILCVLFLGIYYILKVVYNDQLASQVRCLQSVNIVYYCFVTKKKHE